MIKNNYTVGSLFAGVGGICQGFKNAGYSVSWANELDKNACETYKLNHNKTDLIVGDINDINISKLEKIDIVTAGERTSNTLAIFKVDIENRSLVNIAAREIKLGISVYGSCMYKNVNTNDIYAVVNDKKGNVEQYLLTEDMQSQNRLIQMLQSDL